MGYTNGGKHDNFVWYEGVDTFSGGWYVRDRHLHERMRWHAF